MNTTHSRKSAQKIEHAVQDAMAIMSHLHELYEQETDALETMNSKKFVSLQDDKISTAHHYQDVMNALITRKDELKSLPEKTKNELRIMQSTFEKLSDKNLNALQRMNRLSTRLSETIHTAAREAVKKQRNRGYRETGQLHENNKESISMSINETA